MNERGGARHAGDWVEVRSRDEILRTLDGQGRRAGMNGMPEMLAYCGQRLQVSAVAHKSCDTVHWSGNRALTDTVHLAGARCGGEAHGGCKAGCLLFWREEWLKPAEGPAPPLSVGAGATAEDVARAVHAAPAPDGAPRFACQATEHPNFTSKLRNLDPRQYLRDLTTGNVALGAMAMTFAYFFFDLIGQPASELTGAPFRAAYDWWAALIGLVPYPRKPGRAPEGKPQPVAALDLRPGELVRVKPYDEILKTLDKKGRNRGMLFDAELAPYCGGVFRVRSRVDVFIEEQTGKLRTLKTPAIILENVWCRSHFSDRRLFCPRAIYSWWREVWLERAPADAQPSAEGCLGAKAILKNMIPDEPARGVERV